MNRYLVKAATVVIMNNGIVENHLISHVHKSHTCTNTLQTARMQTCDSTHDNIPRAKTVDANKECCRGEVTMSALGFRQC